MVEESMLIESDCVPALRVSKGRVVIFGATPTGELVLQALRYHGIQAVAFCDSTFSKSQQAFCGLEVVYFPELARRLPDADVVIAVADMRDIVEQLGEMGYRRCFTVESLFLNAGNCFTTSFSPEYGKYLIHDCVRSQYNYTHQERVYLRSVDLVITERCSLKCRDCANLMQYFQSPRDLDERVLLQGVDALLQNADEISEFRIIGGEPFMNKRWSNILQQLIYNFPQQYYCIFTNGTICPDAALLKPFRGKKVVFRVSDYGKHSYNIEKLWTRIEEMGFAAIRQKIDEWCDCASIRHFNRSTEELRAVYKNCYCKILPTMVNGVLSPCPFLASARSLGAIPEYHGEYVDLVKRDERETIRSKIRHLYSRSHLQGCAWCSGRSFDPGTRIPPAIQIEKPLPYNRIDAGGIYNPL